MKVDIKKPKNTLNTEFWNGLKLKKEIRLQILKIAQSFYEFLKVEIPIKDIYFTGSMANYNWTAESDVDIHLILDYEPEEFIDEFLLAKKIIWNDSRNITLKGYDVELFAKNKENLFQYKSVYSVLNDKWIQKPEKNSKKLDIETIKQKSIAIAKKIIDLDKINDDVERNEAGSKISEELRELRDSGLNTGNGEYSIGNLVFKTLRKNGYLEKLSDIKSSALDDSLSLDEIETIQENKKNAKTLLKESKQDTDYKLGCLMVQLDGLKKWNELAKIIKIEDIYDKPGYGLEDEPHTTALYGFDKDVDVQDVKDIVSKFLKNKDTVKLKVKGLSIFENKKYDVLKFDVESSDLTKLNAALKKLPNKSDFPNYHPHITVGYLKPGTGKKYVKKFKNTINLESNNFKYSYPPKNVEFFTISDLTRITFGVEKGIEGMTPKKQNIIKKFIAFAVAKLGIEEPVYIYLHKNRSEYIVTTASYVPSENSNHVKAEDRAAVDICRSIAHELTHNRQREIESFVLGDNVQNVGGWIEDEANAKAGILIKDFAMNSGNDELYEL